VICIVLFIVLFIVTSIDKCTLKAISTWNHNKITKVYFLTWNGMSSRSNNSRGMVYLRIWRPFPPPLTCFSLDRKHQVLEIVWMVYN
jgi:hypothetical protein